MWIKKKEILTKFLQLYPNTFLSNDVRKEARSRDMDGILKKFGK